MKKLVFIILLILICVSVAGAKNLTFQWSYDYDDEITGFKLYKRIKSQDYDYDLHIATIPAGTHEVTVDIDGPYIFTVRAYAEGDKCTDAGCESCPCDSSDSNEVSSGQFGHTRIGTGIGFE